MALQYSSGFQRADSSRHPKVNDMPPVPSTLEEWKVSARNYKRVIERFETIQKEMRARRNVASDSVMLVLDDRLKLNERTLKSMRAGLQMAEDEIKRLEV